MIRLASTLKTPPVPTGRLVRRAKRALDLLGLSGAAEFGILLCGRSRIRGLNRKHRGIDKPTDVLSFPFHEDSVPLRKRSGPLGDIAICVPVADRQAREMKCSLEDRMAVLMVHGLLHLAGFDHERNPPARRKMEAMEKRLLEKMGVHVQMA